MNVVIIKCTTSLSFVEGKVYAVISFHACVHSCHEAAYVYVLGLPLR